MQKNNTVKGQDKKDISKEKIMKAVHNEKNKIDYLFAWLILVGAAIQNRFFDEIISVGGMDAVSLLLTIILFITFGRYMLRRKFKFPKDEFILVAYTVCVCAFSVIAVGMTSSVLLCFRTMIYLVITFIFFKNIALNEEDIIHLFRIAGLFNALICLYFYVQNVGIYGAGFRDVSINLYFSLLSIILCLFVKLQGERTVGKYGIALVCMIAIFTSQQRTQIIPLAIILTLFIMTSVGFDVKKIFNMACVCVLVVIVINIAKNIGMLDFVLKRLEIDSILNSNDTLGIRLTTSSNYFSNLSCVQWLIGTGLAGKGELEMLFPNYIYKYGVIGTGIILSLTLLKMLKYGFQYENTYKRVLTIALLLMSIGGVISGFGGQNGQLFVAAIMGTVSNKNIQMNTSCIYSLPLSRFKIFFGGGHK